MDGPITVRQIRTAILAHNFRHANEAELHNGVEVILAGLGLAVQREVRLDPHNRIDLTVQLPRPEGPPLEVGIEVKTTGSAGPVRRQVIRYTQFTRLGAVMLVTTVRRHMIEVMLAAEPAPAPDPSGAEYLLNTKPFDLALIRRGLL